MIIKTNKKDALALIECATQRLQDETFLQINMVGVNWLFVIADDDKYINVHTDRLRNQFEISVYNKHTDRTLSDVYNVTRPTMRAIHDLLANKQDKYIYGKYIYGL